MSLPNLDGGWSSSPRWIYPLAAVGLWILYTASMVVYRLTWHPLARFPGPFLARTSYLYEFWYNVVLFGRYTVKTGELHEKYGPIIRVNPDEIHCNDPKFIEIAYAYGKGVRNKSDHYVAALPIGLRKATVATIHHNQHRVRRVAVNRFFSRASIIKRENLLHQHLKIFCKKLLDCCGGEPFEAVAAFSCYTTDALTSYSFGRSLGNLQEKGWQPAFKGTIDNITGLFYLSRHITSIVRISDWIPLTICRWLSTQMWATLKLTRETVPELVRNTLEQYGKTEPTFLASLIEADVPEHEKSTPRLLSESTAIVLGGTHTIASVLNVVTFHLLNNRHMLAKLRDELHSIVSDDNEDLPPWATLEKLPYLGAVMMESIRLMHGIAGRLPVVAPEEDMVYTADDGTSMVIPRGYAVSMSAYLIHMNTTLFPRPKEFVPERWLDEQGKRDRSLEKYMMSFSKGHRQCVGMHLAYAELYIVIAALALRIYPHMSLYKTTLKDIEYDHDQLISMPVSGSKGVWVRMDPMKERSI